MTFDPTNNRIPFRLLTPEEKVTLVKWPHGWECYQDATWTWIDCVPVWNADLIYRGKPAPKVTSYWFNIYEGDMVGNLWTCQETTSRMRSGNTTLMRMQICNGEVTVTKET